MTDLRKAAQIALDALETKGEHHERVYAAIEALRQALAQPEQDHLSDAMSVLADVNADLIAEAKLAQPEQEPVAWEKNYDIACSLLRQAHDILATTQYPIKRPWVSLTDEERDSIARDAAKNDWHDYAVISATETELRSKNNG